MDPTGEEEKEVSLLDRLKQELASIADDNRAAVEYFEELQQYANNKGGVVNKVGGFAAGLLAGILENNAKVYDPASTEAERSLAFGLLALDVGTRGGGAVGRKTVLQVGEKAGVKYINSARVLLRSAEESSVLHNFPEQITKKVLNEGNLQIINDFWKTSRNHLTNTSHNYSLRGTINGVDGIFEVFTRPSISGKVELIMHKFFRRN